MKVKKQFTQLDAIKSVRKPMPPASRVHTGKKYSKKDRKWKAEDHESRLSSND